MTRHLKLFLFFEKNPNGSILVQKQHFTTKSELVFTFLLLKQSNTGLLQISLKNNLGKIDRVIQSRIDDNKGKFWF